MIEFLKILGVSKEEEPATSGVYQLAKDIHESNDYWSSNDIVRHLDCTPKRAADYLDNLIKGKKYSTKTKSNPRRVKVLSITKQTRNTQLKGEMLTLAAKIQDSGEFWSRGDIKSFFADHPVMTESVHYPSQVAHSLYSRLISNKRINTEVLPNPPRVKVLSINLEPL